VKNLKNINLFILLATASVNLIGTGRMETPKSEALAGTPRSLSPRSVVDTAYKAEQNSLLHGGFFDEQGNFNKVKSPTGPVRMNIDNNTQQGPVRMPNYDNESEASSNQQEIPTTDTEREFNRESLEARIKATKGAKGYVTSSGVATTGEELNLPSLDSSTAPDEAQPVKKSANQDEMPVFTADAEGNLYNIPESADENTILNIIMKNDPRIAGKKGIITHVGPDGTAYAEKPFAQQ